MSWSRKRRCGECKEPEYKIPYCEENFENVLPEFITAVVIGALFSSTSRGFRNYVLFGLFYEIVYAARIRGQYTVQNTWKRLAVFSAGLLTFLVVRFAICDDKDPLRATYSEATSYSDIMGAVMCNRPRKGNRMFGWGKRGKYAGNGKYFSQRRKPADR